MRISDWSSDVCSSDLTSPRATSTAPWAAFPWRLIRASASGLRPHHGEEVIMLRNILAGPTALAMVIAFSAGASANPKNKFGTDNHAAATDMADTNANGASGGEGGGPNSYETRSIRKEG